VLRRVERDSPVSRQLAAGREQQRAAEPPKRVGRFDSCHDGHRLRGRDRRRVPVDADKRCGHSSGHHERRRKHRLQGVERRSAMRQDKRERRRPFEAGRAQGSGQFLGAPGEAAAWGAAAKVGIEQRRLELGQLAVGPQRRPLTCALAQLRSCGHSTTGDATRRDGLVPVRDNQDRETDSVVHGRRRRLETHRTRFKQRTWLMRGGATWFGVKPGCRVSLAGCWLPRAEPG
jgi:hypothetical protein